MTITRVNTLNVDLDEALSLLFSCEGEHVTAVIYAGPDGTVSPVSVHGRLGGAHRPTLQMTKDGPEEPVSWRSYLFPIGTGGELRVDEHDIALPDAALIVWHSDRETSLILRITTALYAADDTGDQFDITVYLPSAAVNNWLLDHGRKPLPYDEDNQQEGEG